MKFCEQCGKELVGGAAFCIYCGAKIPAEINDPVPVQKAAPVPEAPKAAPVPEIPKEAAAAKIPTPVIPKEAAPAPEVPKAAPAPEAPKAADPVPAPVFTAPQPKPAAEPFPQPKAADPFPTPVYAAPQPKQQPQQAPYQQPYQQPAPYQQPQYQQAPQYQPVNYDHTDEFDAKDISDNKVIAMVIYLLGTVGLLIALLCQKSKYVTFHIRQALKLTVLEILTWIAALVLAFIFALIGGGFARNSYYGFSVASLGATAIPLILASILSAALFVIRIIMFVRVCQGKAIEAPIARLMKFMR